MSYTVKLLHTDQTFERPSILLNKSQKDRDWTQHVNPAVEAFHKTLPHYGETELHSLPPIASELGVSRVFIKDESTRFGLPSFKILGASWAVHQTVCRRLQLPNSTSLTKLASMLKERNDVRLVSCTEGNWGRACARMAKYLGIPATLYVPGFMSDSTKDLLRSEGADVKVLTVGSYDDSIAAARADAENSDALLVMDTSWDGYTEIPEWVTEGYETMLAETDRQVAAQTGGKSANMVFVSVGVGSWAHAVVAHYRSRDARSQVVTVEPDTAACFKESLHCGELTPIETGETIMNGMNCGTPSWIAWPVLRDGAYAASTVTDVESHESVEFLQSQNVNAGPCGAAPLAALKKLCAETDMKERRDMIMVLFSTEGMRHYEVPRYKTEQQKK